MVAIIPTIPINNPIQWTVTFADATGNKFDPASGIEISVTDPNGNLETYVYPSAAMKSDVGIYYVVTTLDIAGDWVGNGQGLLADGTPVTTPDVVQRVEASYVT